MVVRQSHMPSAARIELRDVYASCLKELKATS
jgi:hypothetical protein